MKTSLHVLDSTERERFESPGWQPMLADDNSLQCVAPLKRLLDSQQRPNALRAVPTSAPPLVAVARSPLRLLPTLPRQSD